MTYTFLSGKRLLSTVALFLTILCTVTGVEAAEVDDKNYFLDGKYIYKIGDDVAKGEAWLVGVKPGAVLEGEITIPGSAKINGAKYTVTRIGDYTEGLDFYTDNLPNSYKAAFKDFPSITKVNIPSTIEKMRTWEFIGCPGITEFHVNPANTMLRDDNGILFNRYSSGVGLTDKWNLFRMPPATKKSKYTVPSDVVYIESNAFADNKTIKTIILSGSTSFYSGWSNYNLGIREIDVTGSENYENLAGVIYVAGELSWFYLDDQAGKYSVVAACPPAMQVDRLTLPASVKNIRMGAFANTSISEIVLPEGLVEIGPRAFYKSKIKSLRLNADNLKDLTTMMEDMCLDCKELESVEFVGSTGRKLTLNRRIFMGCEKLSSFKAASNNIELCGYAFYGCSSLASFPFAQLSSLDLYRDCEYHFAYSGLTSARIPSFFWFVPRGMFMGSALKSVNLDPSGKHNLIYTYEDAFRDCRLTEVNLARVSKLYPGSFAGNPLKKVVLPKRYEEGETEWDVEMDEAFTPTEDTWFYFVRNRNDWYADLSDRGTPGNMALDRANFVCSDRDCLYIPADFRVLYGPAGSRHQLAMRNHPAVGKVRDLFSMNQVSEQLALDIEQTQEASDVDFAITSVQIGGVEATREGNVWSIPGKGNVTNRERVVNYTVNGVPMQTLYPKKYEAGAIEETGLDTPDVKVDAVYRTDGKYAGVILDALEPGIYIVLYSDGTRRKIIK